MADRESETEVIIPERIEVMTPRKPKGLGARTAIETVGKVKKTGKLLWGLLTDDGEALSEIAEDIAKKAK